MTEKLYYADPYMKEFAAEVVSCSEKDGKWIISLDKTAFYPEGGGQPADTGTIGNVNVLDVHEKNGEILHTCDDKLGIGEKVNCRINWERRFDHMQQHSGEHIVSGMICSAFACDNVGFHMGASSILIDYNAYITDEELQKIEDKSNTYIWEDHPIDISWPSGEELADIDYRSKKELTGAVRIVSFPGADCCACCGTHVSSSGGVGLVKFISRQKFHDGVRLELLCGKRALDYLVKNTEQNLKVSRMLSAKWYETSDAVSREGKELESEKLRANVNEEKYFSAFAEKYRNAGDTIIVSAALSNDSTRKLCDCVYKVCGGNCVVFSGESGAYKYAVMCNDDESLKETVKKINTSLQGRGGGRGGLAQGNVQCTEDVLRSFSL